MQQPYRPSLKIKRLDEKVTLTIATKLAQRHVENILPSNGISITNFNILAKTSLASRFPIPYLSHFFDCGFSDRRAHDCASIVLWPANSTRSSVIYKFPSGLSHHALFRVMRFALKKFRDIQFDPRALTSNGCTL
jgi:hypothetical protein